MAWLDRATPDGRILTAREMVENAGDEELARQYEQLEQDLFGSGESARSESWSGSSFSESIGRARRRWLDQEADKDTREPLPPLNPVGSVH